MKRQTLLMMTLIPLGLGLFGLHCFNVYKQEAARRQNESASPMPGFVKVKPVEDDWSKGYELGYKIGIVSARTGDPVPTEFGLQKTAREISTHSNDIIDRAKFERAFCAGYEAGYKKITKRAF